MAELIRIADIEAVFREQIQHIAKSRRRVPGITDPWEAGRYQGNLEGQEKAYKIMLEEIKRIGRI